MQVSAQKPFELCLQKHIDEFFVIDIVIRIGLCTSQRIWWIKHHHIVFGKFFRSTRETDGTLDFTGVWLFEALGVQFWGKRNPAVVVAVGMWEARVFCGISKREGNGGKVGGRTFPRFPPRVIPTANLPEHRSRHDC